MHVRRALGKTLLGQPRTEPKRHTGVPVRRVGKKQTSCTEQERQYEPGVGPDNHMPASMAQCTLLQIKLNMHTGPILRVSYLLITAKSVVMSHGHHVARARFNAVH